MAHGNSAKVQQQSDFARALCHLILWGHSKGWTLTFGQVERPTILAELYAKMGKGIRDSQHVDRLAADLNLYVAGVYQSDTPAYAALGTYWKRLDRRARWGGDFPKPDGNHFEFIDP